MRRSIPWISFLFVLLLGGLSIVYAAITPEQRRKVEQTENILRKAERLVKEGKFDAAKKDLDDVQKSMIEFAQSPDLNQQVYSMARKVESIRGELELQGISLPDFKLPKLKENAPVAKPAAKSNTPAKPNTPAKAGTPLAKPAVPAKPGAPAKPGEPAGNAMATVSFTKQVAPMLVAKCGRCHVAAAKGELNFGSYDILTKGYNGKLVVQKGDSKNSEAVREIESGSMPKGGVKVTPAELTMFKKWIDDGAKFDGSDNRQSRLPLQQLGAPPGARMTAIPMMPERLSIVASTGSETVSFSRDIAPILTQNCNTCHTSAQQIMGQFCIDNVQALFRGGDGGIPFIPGNAAESLLVKKLKGTAGDRMPKDKPALPDAQIALIEKWIAEGAHFDGGKQNLLLDDLVTMVGALEATHDQLSQQRLTRAKSNFKLAVPDEKPEIVESKNFVVIGNVNAPLMKEISEMAEEQAKDFAKQFKIPDDKPIIKGRITLFALKQSFDYSEWKMVEKRDIPINLRSHMRFNVSDAYAVMWVPAEEKDFSLKALVQEQVAGLFVAGIGQGKMPDWFYIGAGKALSGSKNPRDPRVKFFDQALGEQLAKTMNPPDLLDNKLSPEGNEIMAYGFMRSLTSNYGKFSNVLNSMKAGSSFDQAVMKHYGYTPKQLVIAWAGKGK